jgi:hypothetical protein
MQQVRKLALAAFSHSGCSLPGALRAYRTQIISLGDDNPAYNEEKSVGDTLTELLKFKD